MALSQDIAATISRMQALPNSQARNKAVSHLYDALVWAERLETVNLASDGQTPVRTAENASGEQCICPDGAIDTECRVHNQSAH